MCFENASGKNVKKCVLKTWKNAFWKCTWKKCEKMCFENALEKMRKTVKNAKQIRKKCDEHIWKTSWEGGTLISFSSGLIFWGSSFAAVTLLPAQLLQVENRRGAVQIDRKWTVQIADLLNLAIAKQWLPGAKTSNQMKKEKRTKPQNCFKNYFFSHFFTVLKHIFHISKILNFKIIFFHIFNSNYYNPSVAQLAFIRLELGTGNIVFQKLDESKPPSGIQSEDLQTRRLTLWPLCYRTLASREFCRLILFLRWLQGAGVWPGLRLRKTIFCIEGVKPGTAKKAIFCDLKSCFFGHCPCETQWQARLCKEHFFRLLKKCFFAC